MGKHEIEQAITKFKTGNLTDNSIHFLKNIAIQSDKRIPMEKKDYDEFIFLFNQEGKPFDLAKARTDEWLYIDFLFQITGDELSGQLDIFNDSVDINKLSSYLFFCLELKNPEYSRTVLSTISREINKLFLIPVFIIIKTGDNLTLSIINRRRNKRDESKDVLEKVTLIKDINIEQPHRAHIEILYDLSFEQLREHYTLSDFDDLHNAWQKVLDTKELSKKFYKELSEWYYWAMGEVRFSKEGEPPVNKREENAICLIRLLTRILFVWFIKEKQLVREELFRESDLNSLLIGFDKNSDDSNYYKAILQNLFFATLNQEINKRKFRIPGYNGRGITNQWRYKALFTNKDAFVELMANTPFLNGGLFECLDIFEYEEGREVKKDRNDWFSEETGNPLHVPNKLFFIDMITVDLSCELGEGSKSTKVRGLFSILNSYKFTIAENTPIEEDIALDPELLGNVFENLLASYNPETKTTARKATGSYYTPKEIVNYMVDESLKIYFRRILRLKTNMNDAKIEKNLDILFAYNEDKRGFSDSEAIVLINAIDNCNILEIIIPRLIQFKERSKAA